MTTTITRTMTSSQGPRVGMSRLSFRKRGPKDSRSRRPNVKVGRCRSARGEAPVHRTERANSNYGPVAVGVGVMVAIGLGVGVGVGMAVSVAAVLAVARAEIAKAVAIAFDVAVAATADTIWVEIALAVAVAATDVWVADTADEI